MDFAKFMGVISFQSLYFSPISKLDDPYEGTIPRHNLENRNINYNDVSDDVAKIIQSAFVELTEGNRKNIYANCWHINESESAAMWDLYANSYGIAIQSTVGKLIESFHHTEKTIGISKIKYNDYSNNSIPEENIMSPFIHKRTSFQHENELRVIYHDFLTLDSMYNSSGMLILCDLRILIESVHVSPKTEHWFGELIHQILVNYKITTPVYSSDLYRI